MSHDTETLTLTDFLLARIAEDEAAARMTPRGPFRVKASTSREADAITVHALRWQPERVLAECEAKRRIVETLGLIADDTSLPSTDTADWVLLELARPYADHPAYRDEWRR